MTFNSRSSAKAALYRVAVTAAVLFSLPLIAGAQATINWNDVRQPIDGFGASSAWRSTWSTALANMLFSTNSGTITAQNGVTHSYNGIGLSLLRTRIAPGATTVENSIMQMARDRGARVWSTPWSPAAQFKSNTNVNGGTFVGNAGNYQAYANQLAGYVLNMKNTYGVDLYALSVQNEPNWIPTTYESCGWSAQQIHDFMPYLYNALIASNVASTKIMIPESANWDDPSGLRLTTMNDATTAAMVGIIGNHNYGPDNFNGDNNTPVASTTYGKALWETEVSRSGGDSTITDGIYWAQRVHLFMTVAQANAWHYWWLCGYGSSSSGLCDTNDAPTKRMYTVGNFSRFVRPGFNRIGATNTGALLISAYKNTNSGAFAIVVINSQTTNVTQSFTFNGATIGTVTPWVTSATLSLASQTPITVNGTSFSTTIPASSVVTLTGTGASGCVSAGFASQPANQTVFVGQNATFSASINQIVATNQWEVSTDGGTLWTPIAGATNTSYTVVATTAGQNGNKYRLFTYSVCDNTSATSSAATLTVNVSSDFVLGSWQDNDGDGWVDWANSLSITNIANTNRYRFVKDATSTNAGFSQSLVVRQASYAQSLTLKLQNISGAVAAFTNGSTLRLKFSVPPAANGFAKIEQITLNSPSGFTSVPWSSVTCVGNTNNNENGAPRFFAGGSSQHQDVTVDYSAIKAGITGYSYLELVFTLNAGSSLTNMYFNDVTLVTTASCPGAGFTTQPTNAAVAAGQNATFSAVPFASSTNQWQVSMDGVSWTNIPGQTGNSLVVTGVNSSQDGDQYRLFTYSTCGGVSAVSTAATLNVSCPAVTVAPTTLPMGYPGSAYHATNTASGGSAPYTFAVTSGELPDGVVLSSSGVYSGTPTAAGTYNFIVTGTDAYGCSDTHGYSVVIGCPAITLSPGTLPNAGAGTPYSTTVTATAGDAPYIYTVSSGTLPAGLSLNATNGAITGTAYTLGTNAITITATGVNGCTGNQNYEVIVGCGTIVITPPALTNAFPNIPYGAVLSASGGAGTKTFSLASGALPPGIDLSTNGTFSGSSTNSGTYGFSVTATDTNGCTGLKSYSLTVQSPELSPPMLVVLSPKNNAILTNTATMTGTAQDASGISAVDYSVNGGAYQNATSANGFTNWSASLAVTPGQTTVRVRAMDVYGNPRTNTVSVFFKVGSKLNLLTNGLGTILPTATPFGTPTDGANLDITRNYTVTAVPASGYIFSNWLASVDGAASVAASSNAKYTFTMPNSTNLTLTANFVTNAFIAAGGTYNGLYQGVGVYHTNSGFAQIKVKAGNAKPGSFSGKLYVHGEPVSVSGSFNLAGVGTLKKPAARKGMTNEPIALTLNLDLNGGGVLTGTVQYHTNWSASLDADQATFSDTNATPAAGQYTFIRPGATNVSEPRGDGYGIVTVLSNGTVTAAGYLGDGEKYKSLKTSVSQDGYWPFYSAVYLNVANRSLPPAVVKTYAGSTMGWLQFTNGNVQGTLTWDKTGWTNIYYPAGFKNAEAIVGSPYTVPAPNTRVINVPTGIVELEQVDESFATNSALFDWTVLNKIVFPKTNNAAKFALTVVVKNGEVKGSFYEGPVTKRTYQGAVLQNTNIIRGNYKATTHTGTLYVE